MVNEWHTIVRTFCYYLLSSSVDGSYSCATFYIIYYAGYHLFNLLKNHLPHLVYWLKFAKGLHLCLPFKNLPGLFIMLRNLFAFFFAIFFVFFSCGLAFAQQKKTMFRLLPAAQSGITFDNQLTESDSLNILNQANIYNGGGIGIGDFNGDGLMDIYFAGNMVSNKLYLNKGSLKFEDITDKANATGDGRWCTGVSVVDINADGLPDIYVSCSFRKDKNLRTNLLYINEGVTDGIPHFKESASAYGLADTGFSTQAYFFDYDKDGDLDMYQVTNELYDPKTPIKFRPKVKDGSAKNTDRLYRNNGDGTFTNVSKQAGVTIEGWGHAACITDINMDGWPDIYVANDFVSNDLCFINNHDGTFTDKLSEYFKHTGWNAMGTDAVDINNDGLIDFISLEMLPEDNLRKKRMLSGNEYYNYTNAAKYGYKHQYVRNALQMNSGMTPLGHPIFNDIGYMAGVYQTDWSWCPLVADFDNDGLRDMIISNGLPRDVTDLDYQDYGNDLGGANTRVTSYKLSMTDPLPVVKLADYAFKNNDGLTFKNVSTDWGFTQPNFSNGATYVDLDNDGDLDVVINSINDTAFIYQNTLNDDNNQSHFITVNIKGSGKNTAGFGAHLTAYFDDGKMLYYEHQPCRGYLSTDDPRAHFGLGKASQIDSLKILWADGKQQITTNIKADETITVSYTDAAVVKPVTQAKDSSVFINANNKYGIHFKPKERDFVDYNIQPSIPHKLSQYGPGIAVGDIDGNGFDDFYIGGSSGSRGVFFIQSAAGKFTLDSSRFTKKDDDLYEDMGALLFDADGDKDLDLYIVSGSYEIPPGNDIANDRLFINNGKGIFTKSTGVLPADSTNGSCVRAADFDGDGDLDLFVGGRVISGSYPTAPRSFLYENRNGKFVDVTQKWCPVLSTIGMVTDALFSDYNGDGKADLILTGEWMPVTFLKNTGSAFSPENTGVDNHVGWWNSLVAGDFDNDGNMDYIAGNLGLNTNYTASPAEPLNIYAKDWDGNGLLDPLVFCYMKAPDGSMKPYPMTNKDDMAAQMISVRKKYPTYKSYGAASMDDMFSAKDKEGAMMMKANDMHTSFIHNDGNGKFSIQPLPIQAQEAPVYGMICEDINGDGNPDVLMIGNDYSMEPYSGRQDAFAGLCLQGDGKGNFTPVNLQKSGFFVPGDAKGLATIHTARNEDIIIATQNQDSLLTYRKTALLNQNITKWIPLQSDDFYADITYNDGTERHQEFYYGSTYLSQSSRRLPVEKKASKIVITSFKGIKREVL